jgi:hypothetical protein
MTTVKVAERMKVQPWVIDPDERIMPWEWADRVLTIMNCEIEASKAEQRNAASRERLGRVKNGQGKFQRR